MDVVELVLPTGSCPYLYAWDGNQFKFVTDILGAAPLGLPLNSTRCVEARPGRTARARRRKAIPAQRRRL